MHSHHRKSDRIVEIINETFLQEDTRNKNAWFIWKKQLDIFMSKKNYTEHNYNQIFINFLNSLLPPANQNIFLKIFGVENFMKQLHHFFPLHETFNKNFKLPIKNRKIWAFYFYGKMLVSFSACNNMHDIAEKLNHGFKKINDPHFNSTFQCSSKTFEFDSDKVTHQINAEAGKTVQMYRGKLINGLQKVLPTKMMELKKYDDDFNKLLAAVEILIAELNVYEHLKAQYDYSFSQKVSKERNTRLLAISNQQTKHLKIDVIKIRWNNVQTQLQLIRRKLTEFNGSISERILLSSILSVDEKDEKNPQRNALWSNVIPMTDEPHSYRLIPEQLIDEKNQAFEKTKLQLNTTLTKIKNLQDKLVSDSKNIEQLLQEYKNLFSYFNRHFESDCKQAIGVSGNVQTHNSYSQWHEIKSHLLKLSEDKDFKNPIKISETEYEIYKKNIGTMLQELNLSLQETQEGIVALNSHILSWINSSSRIFYEIDILDTHFKQIINQLKENVSQLFKKLIDLERKFYEMEMRIDTHLTLAIKQDKLFDTKAMEALSNQTHEKVASPSPMSRAFMLSEKDIENELIKAVDSLSQFKQIILENKNYSRIDNIFKPKSLLQVIEEINSILKILNAIIQTKEFGLLEKFEVLYFSRITQNNLSTIKIKLAGTPIMDDKHNKSHSPSLHLRITPEGTSDIKTQPYTSPSPNFHSDDDIVDLPEAFERLTPAQSIKKPVAVKAKNTKNWSDKISGMFACSCCACTTSPVTTTNNPEKKETLLTREYKNMMYKRGKVILRNIVNDKAMDRILQFGNFRNMENQKLELPNIITFHLDNKTVEFLPVQKPSFENGFQLAISSENGEIYMLHFQQKKFWKMQTDMLKSLLKPIINRTSRNTAAFNFLTPPQLYNEREYLPVDKKLLFDNQLCISPNGSIYLFVKNGKPEKFLREHYKQFVQPKLEDNTPINTRVTPSVKK